MLFRNFVLIMNFIFKKSDMIHLILTMKKEMFNNNKLQSFHTKYI